MSSVAEFEPVVLEMDEEEETEDEETEDEE